MTRTVQRDLYAAFKAGALDLTQTGDHHDTRFYRSNHSMRGPCWPVHHRGGLGMSALHTPGPWEWTEDVDGWGHEGLSPDVIRPTVNERIRVDDANARLIAAAPDMLEALREAVEALDYSEMEIKELENTLSDYRQNWTPAKHAAFTCRSAIAKAT